MALAILGTLGGIGWKVRSAGYDACKVEWQQANAAAQQKAEAERVRQEAARATQEKEAIRRLSNEKKRSGALMASLEAHIKAAGPAAQCPVPVGMLDAWNAANAGPQGVSPGTVPPASRPPTLPR